MFYSVADDNKSFVEANLLAGKVYLVDVLIRPGHSPGFWMDLERAHMKPVNPKQKHFDIKQYIKVLNKRRSKWFYRYSEKMNKNSLESAEKKKLTKYKRRLKKYEKKKEKEKVEVLYPDWYIESETILLESSGNEVEEASEESISPKSISR